MLTSETKRRIDACRDVLVGKLPQPSNQVELITLALIYKFMDDLDEESVKLGGKRSFFVNGLTKYRWRNLLPQTVSADERVTLFSEGVEALGHAKKAAHLPGDKLTHAQRQKVYGNLAGYDVDDQMVKLSKDRKSVV